MPAQILLKSGLSVKEAEIYEALLSLGECPISDLLKKTQDHPQIVYRALEKLTALNLVLVSYRRNRKYIKAEDPHIFEKLQEKRLEEIRTGIPDLLAMQKQGSDAVVRVSKGNEAVRDLRGNQINEIDEGGTLYIIGGSAGKYYELIGERHKESERKRVKKKITRKIVTYEGQREDFTKKDHENKLTQFRFLPNNYSIPSSTAICGKKVSITIWDITPLVIEIESAAVAESYQHYFEALWELGKE